MIRVEPYVVNESTVLGIEVKLPKTTLLVFTTEIGYIMCGALDVKLLNEKLGARRIVAGRALGVRTLEQLLDAPLESVTEEAKRMGIESGMSGRDALSKMMSI